MRTRIVHHHLTSALLSARTTWIRNFDLVGFRTTTVRVFLSLKNNTKSRNLVIKGSIKARLASGRLLHRYLRILDRFGPSKHLQLGSLRLPFSTWAAYNVVTASGRSELLIEPSKTRFLQTNIYS